MCARKKKTVTVTILHFKWSFSLHPLTLVNKAPVQYCINVNRQTNSYIPVHFFIAFSLRRRSRRQLKKTSWKYAKWTKRKLIVLSFTQFLLCMQTVCNVWQWRNVCFATAMWYHCVTLKYLYKNCSSKEEAALALLTGSTICTWELLLQRFFF